MKDKNVKSGSSAGKIIKLQVPAGQAAPTPPIGPVLGQNGLNIMDFCKQFNELTKNMDPGMPVPVIIKVGDNRSFTMELKTAPTSYLIKKALGIKLAAKAPGREAVITITKDKIIEVAKMKMEDMGVFDIDAAVASVIGTARSMGIQAIDENGNVISK